MKLPAGVKVVRVRRGAGGIVLTLAADEEYAAAAKRYASARSAAERAMSDALDDAEATQA